MVAFRIVGTRDLAVCASASLVSWFGTKSTDFPWADLELAASEHLCRRMTGIIHFWQLQLQYNARLLICCLGIRNSLSLSSKWIFPASPPHQFPSFPSEPCSFPVAH